MKKKAIVIIAVIAVLAAACTFVYYRFLRDPNLAVKSKAVEIREDEVKQLNFSYSGDDEVKSLKPLYFVPAESREYRFSVTDIVSDGTAGVALYVADEEFADHLVMDNYSSRKRKSVTEDFEGDSYLEKGKKYYIMTVVKGSDETVDFDGSVSISVSKKPEDEEPAQLAEDDSVILTVKRDGQSCAQFSPAESAYFRFDTVITAGDAAAGFSSVSSVNSDEGRKIPMTEGIAWLEAGKVYHVWVNVSETEVKRSDVKLSCMRLNTLEAAGTSETVLEDVSLIEYTAEESGYTAVYSVSKGDPAALVFEKPGFVIRSDDNTALFSENSKDFAMVFKAERGKKYHIAVYGNIKECRVVTEPYTEEEESGEDEVTEGTEEMKETDPQETDQQQ